jgi:hypothetical protein
MKTKISLGILIAIAAMTVASCSNPDEVVPISDSNTSTRTYKVADPVLLNASEQAKVSEIRNEYYDNVDQY